MQTLTIPAQLQQASLAHCGHRRQHARLPEIAHDHGWLVNANRHYRLRDVQRRHLAETARRCGYGEHIETTLHELVQQEPLALAEVRRQLPAGFPMDVFESVSAGLQRMARKIRDI